MIALTLAEIASAVAGSLLRAPDPATSLRASTVHTDSRLVQPGDIFFALPGETTDGHLFAPAAVAGGAAVLIVERELDLDVPQVLVTDGLVALSDLSRAVVARVRAAGELRVVAVTGSNGKTTTKNMLAAIFGAEGPTVAPAGSFNNEVGAPISMLGVTDDTKYLIVEMGADAVGDITKLVSVATPDVGIVLKVGLAHVGKFGSPEHIARAKAEMVTDLPSSAVAVLNADDARVAAMAELTEATVQTFGLDHGADVWASDVAITAGGTTFTLHVDGSTLPVRLRILGEHHVSNALAAITAARALGIPADRSVKAVETMTRAERWRMELFEREDGVIVINDAYNASPDSMAAALKTLAEVTRDGKRSIAILGEMSELGDYADEEHAAIGRLIVRLNVQKLIVVGQNARHIHHSAGMEGSWDGESVLVASTDEAYDLLRDQLQQGDVVLVKSSNSAQLRFLGDRLAGITA